MQNRDDRPSSGLPPLNALRAFETTARHLSVKAAAQELHVTPGAVSQMIKTIEGHLGIRLFERSRRGMLLTEAGQSYLPPIRNAFRQIGDASRRVASAAETGLLTVSVTPFFAATWLVPRLQSFQDAYPQIDLQVIASNTLANFSRDGVDVAVRHGLGRYAGLASDRVVSVEIVPVAAPALVERLGRPTMPAALTRWPLVHDAERKGWQLWFQAQDIAEIPPPRGPSFDDAALLLQAVRAGQGAGLLPAALTAGDVAEGRLVRLADTTMLEAFAYYLVYPDERGASPKIAAFRQWILDMARQDTGAGEPLVTPSPPTARSHQSGRLQAKAR